MCFSFLYVFTFWSLFSKRQLSVCLLKKERDVFKTNERPVCVVSPPACLVPEREDRGPGPPWLVFCALSALINVHAQVSKKKRKWKKNNKLKLCSNSCFGKTLQIDWNKFLAPWMKGLQPGRSQASCMPSRADQTPGPAFHVHWCPPWLVVCSLMLQESMALQSASICYCRSNKIHTIELFLALRARRYQLITWWLTLHVCPRT